MMGSFEQQAEIGESFCNLKEVLMPTMDEQDDNGSSGEVDDDPDQFPDPVEKYFHRMMVKFPGIPNPNHDQVIQNVLECLLDSRNAFIECPFDGERRLGTLAAVLAHCHRRIIMGMGRGGASSSSNLPHSSAQEGPSRPKVPPSKAQVFYVTKSFEEITAVIQELKKFKKSGYLPLLKIAVVGPHDKLCEQHASAPGGNSSCSAPTDAIFDFILEDGTVFEIKDLLKASRDAKLCPYHLSKNSGMVERADIVFCPQEFILSPFLRQVYGLKLDKAAVIFDDGNNIEASCYDHGSLSISTVMMNVAAEKLEASLTAVNEECQSGGGISPEMRTALNSMEALAGSLKSFSAKVKTDYLAVLPLERKQISLQSLRDNGFGKDVVTLHIDRFQWYFKFTDKSQNCSVKLDPKTIANISNMLTVIYELNNSNHLNDFSLHVYHFRPRVTLDPDPIIVFKIICSTPKIIFNPILQQASSVIIGSGCLPPKEVLRHELGPENFVDGATVLEHQTNCYFAYCGTGPNGVKFDFEMKHRDRSTVHDEAGEAILEICKSVTSGGIIVFFGSRDVLQKMTQCWNNGENRGSSILDEIKEYKHVFSELAIVEDGDVRRQIDQFAKLCLKPIPDRTGAIFFALNRGRVNKAMDFKKNEVRMIVTCGLPYDSLQALHVAEKQKHFQAIYQGDNGKLSKKWADLWYNAEMFHNVNRTLAHCVRNGQDWFGGILLDDRVCRRKEAKNLEQFISPWIYQDLNHYEVFQTMIVGLQDFVGNQLTDDL